MQPLPWGDSGGARGIEPTYRWCRDIVAKILTKSKLSPSTIYPKKTGLLLPELKYPPGALLSPTKYNLVIITHIHKAYGVSYKTELRINARYVVGCSSLWCCTPIYEYTGQSMIQNWVRNNCQTKAENVLKLLCSKWSNALGGILPYISKSSGRKNKTNKK